MGNELVYDGVIALYPYAIYKSVDLLQVRVSRRGGFSFGMHDGAVGSLCCVLKWSQLGGIMALT